MDSHIAAGKKNTPINVTLPNTFSPFFTVEDFGTGLTEDEVYDIYGSYGVSTKRHSNDFNGQLGFGCKAAFSYTDQFTVTSIKDGILRTFVFSLGEDGVGEITKMQEELTDRPNGVKVSVPVKLSDLSRFRDTANSFYKYWEVMPKGISIQAQEYALTLDVGKYRISVPNFNFPYDTSCYMVMGNVAYPVPSVVMNEFHAQSGGAFRHIGAVINVPIGEIHFTPSREELKITPNLIQILKQTYSAVYDHVKQDAEKEISGADNYIEALKISLELKKKYGSFFHSFKNNLEYKGYDVTSSVYLEGKHATFYRSNGKVCKYGYTNVGVDEKTAFLIVSSEVSIEVKSYYLEVRGFKAKQIRAMRNFLNETSSNYLVLVKDTKDIPKENSVFGIPVWTMDKMVEEFAPKEEPRERKPRGIGLYAYVGTKGMVSKSIEPLSEDEIPVSGQDIVVLELDGYRPTSKVLLQLSSYMEQGYKLLREAGIEVYAARSGNMKRISKEYNVIPYEEALAEHVENLLHASPNSAKASYSIPIANVELLDHIWYLFKGDSSDVSDKKLRGVIQRAKKIREQYQEIVKAPPMNSVVSILKILKGDDYVRTLIHGMYEESLEVEGLDEVFVRYPLLTYLSRSGVNVKDVKDYVNAMNSQKGEV